MSEQLIRLGMLIAVFVIVVGFFYLVYLLATRDEVIRRLQKIEEREDVEINTESDARVEKVVEAVAKAVEPMAKFSIPDEDWQKSEFISVFVQAGLRNKHAPIIYFGLKSLLACCFPLIAFFVLRIADPNIHLYKLIFWITLTCAIGFYLPNIVIRFLHSKRRREVFDNLPDAIDLLTICVSAGLSLGAAFNKVASELKMTSKVLYEDFQLLCLELGSGGGKELALRNFAKRTGVEEVSLLATMLIQSEKFGTEVGESLRVHSEMLRVKRQQRAEEQAAKITVKMAFPLVLCIFPAILIVVAGPAMIRITKTLPTLMGGG